MLTNLEYLFQRSSVIVVNSWVMCSSMLQPIILVISIMLILFLSSLMNSSSMMIDTDKGAWLEGLHISGKIWWLLNSSSSA